MWKLPEIRPRNTQKHVAETPGRMLGRNLKRRCGSFRLRAAPNMLYSLPLSNTPRQLSGRYAKMLRVASKPSLEDSLKHDPEKTLWAPSSKKCCKDLWKVEKRTPRKRMRPLPPHPQEYVANYPNRSKEEKLRKYS